MNHISFASLTHRWAFSGSVLALSLFAAGCVPLEPPISSLPASPIVYTPIVLPPAPPAALDFSVVSSAALENRSNPSAQDVIAEANRITVTRSTSRADYLRCTRLLVMALESGAAHSAEEELRLSVMSYQFALRADDRESLPVIARHWESGFKGIRHAPAAGEIETHLLAARRLGAPIDEKLLALASPDFQPLLRSDY